MKILVARCDGNRAGDGADELAVAEDNASQPAGTD